MTAPGGERRETVSACLIVRDEEKYLGECLTHLAFCDEVVVVDSGSTDATVAIARAAGARVHEHAWPGFAAQRNIAIGLAKSDWVLEVDADERVNPELAAEIMAFLAAPAPGFDIAGFPMRDRFLGRLLGPSARYPKYRIRLFRRGAYRHDESRTVHEQIKPHGPVWPFQGDMEHLLAESLAEALRDMRRYAALESRQVPAASSWSGYLVGILARPSAKALYRLTIGGGWRDGWHGVLRILLDCASDAIVWLHVARREPRAGDVPQGHFGHGRRHVGSPRFVGLAAGRRPADEAVAWLSAAQAEGADVALITDADPCAPGIRIRRVASLSPLAVVRAVDAESQLRALDGLVPVGRRARILALGVPAGLRGPSGLVLPRTSARDAVVRAHERRT